MSRQYEIPARVMANAEKRLAVAARARRRSCVYDGCEEPATHWPATGSPACETHRSRPHPPVPDPRMGEAHLRRTRGAMYTPARTDFDNQVEAKGQRVSVARRAQARGDQP